MMIDKQPKPAAPLQATVGPEAVYLKPLTVTVAGGGPVGLFLAHLLISYLGDGVEVTICDARYRKRGGRVVWANELDGNQRRQQVVTLQSNVWATLPEAVQQLLFRDPEAYSEMWPYGPDSPESRGRPRNLRIRYIEDQLLEGLAGLSNVELVPHKFTPELAAGRDVLAICEGARSNTRDEYKHSFGPAHPRMYELAGNPLSEVVLGMQVESDLPDGLGVLLTVSQNRFLLNKLGRHGFLNMRLTRAEAAELLGVGANGYTRCLQGRPCVMARDLHGSFRCPTHGSVFKPNLDPTSFLWPRLQDGLRLFGIEQDNLRALSAFEFRLLHRPRFVSQLPNGAYGCLIGDAALAIHFWPGRGLNTGTKAATSLARCLRRNWRGRRLRQADLDEHEGVMHMLQSREINNRAWNTMLMRGSLGQPYPIEARIEAALQAAADRTQLSERFLATARLMRQRLAGRMGPLPNDEELRVRLGSVSARTLQVLVETGPWITDEVGGPEIDVAAMLPLT